MDFKVQTSKEHYKFSEYVNLARWESYYYQLQETQMLSPTSVLVIGVGDNIVVNLLKNRGYTVYTLDIDPELSPTICGSITDLDSLAKNLQVDVILCCQVLEHLPFSYFNRILKSLSKHCKYLILSLPYSYLQIIRISIKFERIRKRIINIRIPLFWKSPNVNAKHSEGHYWEIGLKNSSMKRVIKEIESYFSINKRFFPTGNPYHYFIIAKSLNQND